jgi:hypothetical protein
MSWSLGHVFSLTPGNSITVWYWFKDFQPHGVQIARPMPEILGPDERTGSDFGFLDCRLVASDDAVERVDERHVRYSVTVTQEATLGGKYSRPLFEIIGGGVT